MEQNKLTEPKNNNNMRQQQKQVSEQANKQKSSNAHTIGDVDRRPLPWRRLDADREGTA
jgi:hypothetical protein